MRPRAVGLERRAVDDQPRRDVEDAAGFHQPVLAQGGAGRDEIDDPPGKPQRGGDLHRAVQLDAFGLDAAALEMAAGEVGIFGRDAQMAGAIDALRSLARLGHRQAAMADVEIDRRIEVGVVEFLDHVGTDDAQLRRAMRDEGRHVEGAHADQPHVVARRGEGQRAVALVVEPILGHHAGARHHGQRLVEDAALGNGEGEALVHDGRR